MTRFVRSLVFLLALIASSAYAQTTVTIGANTGNTFTGVEDTRITLTAPTSNFSVNGTTEVHKFAPGNWANTVIRFTGLSNITPPVTVSAASMFIWCTDNGGGATQAIAARRLLRAWVNTQVTWNVYAGANAWDTAGGFGDGIDREATPAGTLSSVGAAGSYKEIPLDTALVEGWINGTFANDGLHLARSDSSNDGVYMTFISNEGADTNRPYLSVTYTAAEPPPGNLLLRRRRH